LHFRTIDAEEQGYLTHYLANIFTCNYKKLPPEALSHVFISESNAMDAYWRCFAGESERQTMKTKRIFDRCKQHIHIYCEKNIEHAINNECHKYVNLVNFIIDAEQGNVSFVGILLKVIGHASLKQPPNVNKIRAFVSHALCVKKLQSNKINPCLDKSIGVCRRTKFQVLEIVRMRMKDLSQTLDTFPDIHVIYFTRDPRAVIHSRVSTGKLTWDKTNTSHAREASIFCPRISDDVMNLITINQRYPGVVHVVRYEDLVTNPISTAKTVYKIFNSTPPSEWREFVKRTMHSEDGAESGGFGINVKNASELAYRWRKELPADQMTIINKLCSVAISGLGYDAE
jgi:hypothetical protein